MAALDQRSFHLIYKDGKSAPGTFGQLGLVLHLSASSHPLKSKSVRIWKALEMRAAESYGEQYWQVNTDLWKFVIEIAHLSFIIIMMLRIFYILVKGTFVWDCCSTFIIVWCIFCSNIYKGSSQTGAFHVLEFVQRTSFFVKIVTMIWLPSL